MNKTAAAQSTKTTNLLPASQSMLQRKCACDNHTVAGGECAECAKKKGALQRKLAIGASNDPLEREADRVADHVMAAPANSAGNSAPLHIQRYVSQATEGAVTAPASVDSVLASSSRPLDQGLRQDMEQRFGYDFSRVRVHSGAVAEQSARDVNANAYTVGHNIVFGAGRFAPGTHEGRRLIAHELTHVVQQSVTDRNWVGQHNEKHSLIQNAQETGALANKQEPNPALSNVVQRQPTQYYEKSESDVVESVIEVLQQSNNIAGLNVDPAFEILNPYPLPFQTRVLIELYDRGSYFHGLLGYLAPGTKANYQLIVAIRFTQCQKDPNTLIYEDILEVQKFLNYVSLPPELRPMHECLEREGVRFGIKLTPLPLPSGTGCKSCPFFCGYDKSKDLSRYNCGGLAYRTYVYHDLVEVRDAQARGKKISCTSPCDSIGMIKFWQWEYYPYLEDSSGKLLVKYERDFHIVGGPTAGTSSPMDSDEFYSKDGKRPVYGPNTAPSFKPRTKEPATKNDPTEAPILDSKSKPVNIARSIVKESCHCYPCPKDLKDAQW